MKYVFESLPATADELGSLLQSPEGAVAACIAALKILSADPAEGEKALKTLDPGVQERLIRLAKDKLGSAPYIINSYFQGTGPESGYTLPEELSLTLETNPYSGSEAGGSIKFFAGCSGASSPRPVTVKKRDDGTWYPHEWSSLIVGISPPKGV